MYQPLQLVDHENVPLFRTRHDESMLSLMLAFINVSFSEFAFSALTLLVGRQEWHLACKKWGMVEVGTG